MLIERGLNRRGLVKVKVKMKLRFLAPSAGIAEVAKR